VATARYSFPMRRSFLGHKAFKGRGALSNPAGTVRRTDGRTGRRRVVSGGGPGKSRGNRPAGCRARHRKRAMTRRMWGSMFPSIRIAAAVTPASIASRGPTHAYLGLSPGLDFETTAFLQGRRRQAARGRAFQTTIRVASRLLSASTPTATSRWNGASAYPAGSSRCWPAAGTRLSLITKSALILPRSRFTGGNWRATAWFPSCFEHHVAVR